MTNVKLNGKKEMSLQANLGEFKNPNLIVIPLANHTVCNCTSLVKVGDRVLKGEKIAERNDCFYVPIFSSVSGTVTEMCETYYTNGKLVPAIKIKNDHLDECFEHKIVISKQADKFVNFIKDFGFVGMGGSGFPTYVKYLKMDNINTLLINAAECEPYITADFALLQNDMDGVFKSLKLFNDVFKFDKIIIGIKRSEKKLIKQLRQKQVKYPFVTIKEVKDIYPAGWERNLVKMACKETYNVLPSEKGIIVNNVTTIYSIYKSFHSKQPLSEKIVTISGEEVLMPQNLKVTIGTPLEEVFNHIDGIKKHSKDTRLILGGPMLGNSIPNLNSSITTNLNSLLVMKRPIDINEACIRCGFCSNVCPAGISPVMIKDCIGSVSELKKLHPEKCMECGLCSFVCPSKIKIVDFVIKGRDNVRRSK